jgi:hypothetical protein
MSLSGAISASNQMQVVGAVTIDPTMEIVSTTIGTFSVSVTFTPTTVLESSMRTFWEPEPSTTTTWTAKTDDTTP